MWISGPMSSNKSLKLYLDEETHEHLGIWSWSVRPCSMVLLVTKVWMRWWWWSSMPGLFILSVCKNRTVELVQVYWVSSQNFNPVLLTKECIKSLSNHMFTRWYTMVWYEYLSISENSYDDYNMDQHPPEGEWKQQQHDEIANFTLHQWGNISENEK